MDVYKTEEEQVESIKAWWQENGRALLIGISIAIASVFAWDGWQAKQLQHAQAASDLYQQLSTELASDKALELIENIEANYSATPYAALAGFQKAKLQLAAGDEKAAQISLEKVVAEADSNAIRNIAKLRLLRLRLGNGEATEVIAEIDTVEATGFASQYQELKGDAYRSVSDLDNARVAYRLALSSAASNKRFIQQKLDDLGPAIITVNEEEAAE